MQHWLRATLLLLWLGSGSIVHADPQLNFHFGAHNYGAEGTQSLLGVEAGYRFATPVSLNLGGHYLSTDLGGTATGFQQYRVSLGADYHFQLWCLAPFEISPGVGLAYALRDQESNVHIVGGYARAKILVPLVEGFAAGMVHRLDWNRFERPGREFAAVVRFTFQ